MLDRITTRQASSAEFDNILTFYHCTVYNEVITAQDNLFVAEIDGTILGAVRLCEEEGHLVLRGMRLLYTRRRQEVAARLLRVVEAAIGERRFTCLPCTTIRSNRLLRDSATTGTTLSS